jgi:hypothetical protein
MIGIAKKEMNYSTKNVNQENEKQFRLRIIKSL